MVILISIMVVTVALGTSLFVGWILKKLRERDERIDAERLKALKEIDENLKKYYNEQKSKSGEEGQGAN